MRKVTAGLFHSIDGAVEAPNEWQFDQFDDELGGLLGGVLGRTDAVIMGRKGFGPAIGRPPSVTRVLPISSTPCPSTSPPAR